MAISEHVAATPGLPLIWVALGGYDPRFIDPGSEEFRRITNSAISLMSGIVTVSYTLRLDFARGYELIAQLRRERFTGWRKARICAWHRLGISNHIPGWGDA